MSPTYVVRGGRVVPKCGASDRDSSHKDASLVRSDVHFTSVQIHPHIGRKYAPRTNEHGEPQFASRREVAKFEEATRRAYECGEIGTQYHYDEL